MSEIFFKSHEDDFKLFLGDVFDILPRLEYRFDMVFADPPYFLSNNGLTFSNGRITSVNKGEWDKGENIEQIHNFNLEWIRLIKSVLKPEGTIWVSGTKHNIFSIGMALLELGFRILNTVVWQKTNPPPNFSKRYFQHSNEIIIWAKIDNKSKHYFNYEQGLKMTGGKQLNDVWLLPAVLKWEKDCGKHPTQKPLPLLSRIILTSSPENALILDPFTGSSTTGIAANIYNRNFIGIDINRKYLEISKCRKEKLDVPKYKLFMKKKIEKIIYKSQKDLF